ncbi:MAG: hypothetical protein K6G45_09425 [Lachnospiraceae bacterium]|nr:hypothetical protein [Lachnospiraceae bacterium]
MKNVREIFEENIKMLGYIDRALIYCRQCRYDKALYMISQTGDGINTLCDAIIKDPEYFGKVSADSISEMLSGILEARRKKDYILLGDLYELQVISFITGVQQIILNKEDFLDFTPEVYTTNIERMKAMAGDGLNELNSALGDQAIPEDEFIRTGVNSMALLDQPLEPENLLKRGYSIEFTSCGMLTMRAPFGEDEPIYLHTNGNIVKENFMLAQEWSAAKASKYIVFGFGLGYHINELRLLNPDAQIIVYESDPNVLKLYAAFADGRLLDDRKISIVPDPGRTLIEKRLGVLDKDEGVCIHYPSMRREPSGQRLSLLVPWSQVVEEL